MLKHVFICLLLIPLFGSPCPELTKDDVGAILHQIQQAHVCHKQISKELVLRALTLYAEELDPTKTYLTQAELAPYCSPPDEQLEAMTEAIRHHEDYTPFFNIHTLMCRAIERRARLEQDIPPPASLDSVKDCDFKNLTWVEDETDLCDRLTMLLTLQHHALSKLDNKARGKALARMAKKRALREAEIKGGDEKKRLSLVYCTILKAFSAACDAHTCYFTPAEAAQFLIQVQQRLFGIGAQLRDDLTGFTVVKILEGGPASRNTGLKNGDRIIAINEEPVVGLEITDAVELIRGEAGTVVHLTVLRETAQGEETHEISIERGEVVIQESRIETSTIPYADGVIALVTLHAFYQDPIHSSAADVYEAICNIRKEHKLKGIIIDLRDNTGGVLPQAISVTGLFITKGIVASIKDHLGQIEHLREIDGRMVFDGPLVVLTSRASASAAEIVAQSLQDYGRAIIVGDERTFGKGSFQTFTLDAATSPKINPKGEFKVTRGCYYTVSGKSPQLVGVTPDIIVPGPLAYCDIGEQHHKFPLANDQIKENFQDDLSDIPPAQREHISWLYRFNLQQKVKMYTKCLPMLQDNSAKRIAEDPVYQQFLTDLREENFEGERFEFYTKLDLQLKETINIMKDLILLLN